jgi:gliding motility-associated-like protein
MVITSETCVGNNGSITGITATGSGLTYSWNFVTYPSADATGLSNGSYGLLVTDQYGCNAVAGPFNVGYIPGPSISATNLVITNETCSNSNGSIVGLQATGTGLTYDWNGTLTFNEDNTGIPAGNYTLTVTDNLGCTATYGPVNITNTPAPTISTTNMVITDENCNSANGSITGITVSGGLLNYTYSWNSGAYSTLDISSLPAGNYSLLVTDANGCAATAGPFTINNTGGPTINTTNILITPESCAGNDGSIGGITVTGTGLSYEWNSTPSPLNINNQTAGNYTLVVTDVNGCTATAGPFTIPASTTLSLDSSNMVITPAGCTVNSGSIEGLVIVGGVNPQFDWDNSSATLDNTGLASGTYVLDILDDQGCTVQASFYVGQTSPPVIGITNVIFDTVHCAQTDGGISGIDVTGGTEPYSYVWDGNSALNTLNISNQTAGNHTLVVTDDMGCQDSQTLLIPSVQGPVINAGSLSVTNSTCEQPNGSIQGLNVTGDQPFTYSWTNSSLTSLNLTGIVQGTYTLTVTDANGCQTTGNPISVTTTPLPLADFSYTPNTIIPNDLVSFTDETTNATPVTWAWYTDGAPFSNSENPVYTYTTEGNYVVMLVVTTATGCTDTVIKTIQVFGELIVPSVVTRNNDGVNDEFFVKNLKPNTKLVVENRWGSVVYTSDDYQNDWSGNDMEGIKLTEGTYFYQLITVDGKILQGNVYLLNH